MTIRIVFKEGLVVIKADTLEIGIKQARKATGYKQVIKAYPIQ